MKITPEQLKAVQDLLPDNEAAVGDGYLVFYIRGESFFTDDERDAAIFCDLLERACEAKRISFRLTSPQGSCRNWDLELWPDNSELVDDIFLESAPTKLEAWVLAVTELHGRFGK